MSLWIEPDNKFKNFIKEDSIESSSPADLSRAEEDRSEFDEKEWPSVPPENEEYRKTFCLVPPFDRLLIKLKQSWLSRKFNVSLDYFLFE